MALPLIIDGNTFNIAQTSGYAPVLTVDECSPVINHVAFMCVVSNKQRSNIRIYKPGTCARLQHPINGNLRKISAIQQGTCP